MNILITGTSSGVGFGLANHYLAKGNTVYGISRRTNSELNQNTHFKFLSLDLSDFEDIRKRLPFFLNGLGTLHLVILNAGILNPVKDLKDTGLDEIRNVMDVNVWANKVVIDVLFKNVNTIQQIVAISSGAAVSGSRGWNAYALSKAALNMMISLYAAEHTGTHFCSLAPGLIDTAMQDYIYNLPEDDTYPVVQMLKKAKGTEQMPQPEQAAQIISEVIKNATDYESGSFLDVRNM
jgi:benzil reductase ((S)-benzoin forming)